MKSRGIALILAASLMAPQLRAQEPSPSFTCGLNAAYIYLNRTGHHVAYSELEMEFSRQNPPDSLLAIKNILQ